MRRFALMSFLIGSVALAACAGGVTSSGAGPDDLQGTIVDPPQPKPEFVLRDTTGAVFDFTAETSGKLTLLYFGYLNCPDICPVHLAQIAETLDRIPDVANETEVVFVTVDPKRDSPQKMREYLDNFDPDFIGLTGTLDEIEAAEEAAGVPPATFEGEGDDYSVGHAATVFAFAPDGLNYAVYPFGIRQSQWDNDLQILARMTSR